MNVVISQSMYFPWVGMLEQMRLADVFVHYDDVPFSKGSFTNRVQIKQPGGSTVWMTVPLYDFKLGQRIDEVLVQDRRTWVSKHLTMLRYSFGQAPYAHDALGLAEHVFSGHACTISNVARTSMLALADYLGLSATTRFVNSADLKIQGSSSQRVLDVVKLNGGTRYITGHGASQYLDHRLFEKQGIEVAYMDYQCKPYAQSHGAFTPYVSALDLIAHVGPAGIDCLVSNSIYWRDFLNEPY